MTEKEKHKKEDKCTEEICKIYEKYGLSKDVDEIEAMAMALLYDTWHINDVDMIEELETFTKVFKSFISIRNIMSADYD